VLAVVLAVGLLIVGGVALWGALSGKGDPKAAAPQPSSSATTKSKAAGKPSSSAPGNAVGNTVELHCLAAQCQVFVAGPGPTDVQFNGNLAQNVRRVYNETHLTVVVGDASTVVVTINGHQQALGKRGQAKTYEVPPP
jgi:hypothetical protein